MHNQIFWLRCLQIFALPEHRLGVEWEEENCHCCFSFSLFVNGNTQVASLPSSLETIPTMAGMPRK